MKHLYQLAILLLIVTACIEYIQLATHKPPNSDERASLVMALGRHPALIGSDGLPISFEAYLDSLNYKRYSSSQATFHRTIQSVVKDNSNGLFYYLLLTAWIKIFGLNIFYVRCLTLVITFINICLIWCLAKCMGIRDLFVFLLLITIIVNPIFRQDAILVRSYMLALTGCLISAVCLYKILFFENGSVVNKIFYITGLIIALGSHYFTLPLVLSMSFLIVTKKRKQLFTFLCCGYGILFLLILIWIFYIYPVIKHTSMFFYERLGHLSNGTGYSLTPKNAIRQLFLFTANMVGNISDQKLLSIIFKIISGSVLSVLVVKMFLKSETGNYLFLSSLTIFPLVIFFIQSCFSGNFYNFIPHYLVLFLPFWCILLYLEVQSSQSIHPVS